MLMKAAVKHDASTFHLPKKHVFLDLQSVTKIFLARLRCYSGNVSVIFDVSHLFTTWTFPTFPYFGRNLINRS